jgi:site-specific DNA-methyltransferase (adenine-specific)
MKKIPDKKIDLIVTDPPFAINFKSKKANYNRIDSNVIKGYNDIHPKNYKEFTVKWIREANRILKDAGSMYVVSGYNNLNIILNTLQSPAFNFQLQNQIIWKFQFGVVTRKKFVTSHYSILFVTKYKSKYNFYPNCRFSDNERLSIGGKDRGSARYADMEDVWHIKREYWTGEKKTPTKLPSDLIRKILEYSSKKNDLVLDPFLGSGQVAIVAKEMRRKYCGFEIVKNYFDFAKERLES